jgi:hypothetical protein
MSIDLLIISFLTLTSLIFISHVIGSSCLKFLKIEENFLCIITGYSVIVLISNTLFFLDFKVQFIRNTLIFFLVLSLLILFLNNLKFNFLKILKEQIFIYIFFLLTILFYGEQFYIFRGNHYDAINYTAMSLLSSNFSYSEIEQINSFHNNSFYHNYSNVFLHDRPTVSILISLVYLPKIIDLFLVNYIFKIFFLVIVQQAFSYFLSKIYNEFSSIKIFFISNIFTFSFFTLYIFEIDAYSQLASLGISIVFLSLIIFSDLKNYSIKLILFLSVISSAFFLIYPEQAILYFVLAFSYLIYRDYKIFLNKNLIFIPLFLILTLPSFQIYKFLLNQLLFSKDFTGDWWGYFGAFILGSQNIILDETYVQVIRESIKTFNKIEILKLIYNLNFEEHGKFFFLNFLPGLVGAYYVDALKNFNLTLYLVIAICLNFGIIYFLVKNMKIIFNDRNIFHSFLKFFIFFYILVTLIFLTFTNLWILIKIYFYFAFIIFIITFSSLNINSKNLNLTEKYNFLLIIFILLFPIYKYSNYNHGIGTYDSMPSVMNKNYKTKYNLKLPSSVINNCKKIYVVKKNQILDNFVAAKLLYYKKEFKFIVNEKEINKCKI